MYRSSNIDRGARVICTDVFISRQLISKWRPLHAAHLAFHRLLFIFRRRVPPVGLVVD